MHLFRMWTWVTMILGSPFKQVCSTFSKAILNFYFFFTVRLMRTNGSQFHMYSVYHLNVRFCHLNILWCHFEIHILKNKWGSLLSHFYIHIQGKICMIKCLHIKNVLLLSKRKHYFHCVNCWLFWLLASLIASSVTLELCALQILIS